MAELIDFQTFPSMEAANEVAGKLEAHDIETNVAKLPPRIDSVFIGAEYADAYVLKIPPGSFTAANDLLFNEDTLAAAEAITGHPLNAMSSDELLAVMGKPDEWGPLNYHVARQLLAARGVDIPMEALAGLREERMEVLEERQKFSSFLLVTAYGAAIIPFVKNMVRGLDDSSIAIWSFPGFLGVIMGLVITISKTTLPDGRRIYTYDNPTIRHGIRIVALNVLSWLINAVLFFFFIMK